MQCDPVGHVRVKDGEKSASKKYLHALGRKKDGRTFSCTLPSEGKIMLLSTD